MTANAAYKPGGGVWGDSSDLRIKNVWNDYLDGLDQIKQLRPVRYSFKGNDTAKPALDIPPMAPVRQPGRHLNLPLILTHRTMPQPKITSSLSG